MVAATVEARDDGGRGRKTVTVARLEDFSFLGFRFTCRGRQWWALLAMCCGSWVVALLTDSCWVSKWL